MGEAMSWPFNTDTPPAPTLEQMQERFKRDAEAMRNMTPKGETIPQTVEHLQAIMARDAETMVQMQLEINRLKQINNKLRQKLAGLSDKEAAG